MSAKKGKKGKGKKGDSKEPTIIEKVGDFKIDTTLHGYPMVGPHTPSQKDVWYCDNKTCQYTQHGVYRRYKIQNWRSQQFGKKFVLCDGCVRQYQKVKPIQQQAAGPSNVNVKVNINAQPGAQPGQQYVQQPQYAQQQYAYAPNGQMIAQPQPIVQQPQGQYINYGMQQQGYQQQGMQQPVFTQHQQPMQPQMAGINGYQAQQPMQPQVMVVKQPTQLDQPQEQKIQHNEGLNNGNNNNINNGNGGIQIIKQGWMMKKGDIVKSWKKRYFVLKTNQTLNYYESDNAVMVKGTCQLNKVKSVKKKSGQSFEVQTPKRKWCFACKDTATRDDWVAKVKQVAGK